MDTASIKEWSRTHFVINREQVDCLLTEVERLQEENNKFNQRFDVDSVNARISRLEKMVETATDEETKRWCDGLNWLHTEYGADCSGCDSGDLLDCAEVEIRQAIAIGRERMGKEILRLIDDLDGEISESGCLIRTSPFGQWVRKETIYTAIKEKFGLEI